MSCLHVAKWNPVLLLLRWAGSPPPMWKRRTDFAQRTASAQRPFKADRLQRPQLFSASCKLFHLIKPQKLWLKWKRQCPPPQSCRLTDSEQMSTHMLPERCAISRLPLRTHREVQCPEKSPPPAVLGPSFPLTLHQSFQTYVECHCASVSWRSWRCWGSSTRPSLEKHRNEAQNGFVELSLRLLLYFSTFELMRVIFKCHCRKGLEPFVTPPHSLQQALFECWCEV